MKTASYASHGVKEKLQHHTIERRSLKAKDVLIEIEYCGVCHTDLHFVNNDWGMTEYPVVPGPEIVGRITEVGSEAENFRLVIWLPSVAWLTHAGNAVPANQEMSNIASMVSLPHTTPLPMTLVA